MSFFQQPSLERGAVDNHRHHQIINGVQVQTRGPNPKSTLQEGYLRSGLPSGASRRRVDAGTNTGLSSRRYIRWLGAQCQSLIVVTFWSYRLVTIHSWQRKEGEKKGAPPAIVLQKNRKSFNCHWENWGYRNFPLIWKALRKEKQRTWLIKYVALLYRIRGIGAAIRID